MDFLSGLKKMFSFGYECTLQELVDDLNELKGLIDSTVSSYPAGPLCSGLLNLYNMQFIDKRGLLFVLNNYLVQVDGPAKVDYFKLVETSANKFVTDFDPLHTLLSIAAKGKYKTNPNHPKNVLLLSFSKVLKRLDSFPKYVRI